MRLLSIVRGLRRFWRGDEGSVGIVFTLLAIPIVGIIGFAGDFAVAMSRKQELLVAADATALAAITRAQAYVTAGKTGTALITDAESFGLGVFTANAGTNYSLLDAAPTIKVVRSGQVITATVGFTASSPTIVGRLFGVNQFKMSESSASSLTMPQYLSFYLLLDVSGSMGLPSTDSGETALAAINPDDKFEYPNGCTFACHFTTYKACQNTSGGQMSYCQGFNLSRTNGKSGTPVTNCPQPDMTTCIQLRVDAVAYAVQQLLLTAKNTATLTNQFSVGLYPFIRYMQAYQPLSTDLTGAVTTAAAGLINLLDTGNGGGSLGSGGTHFENALPSMNTTIATVGNGSAASSPKPFVFLVTDGAQDNQYQISNGSWNGSNNATTLDETLCAAMKNRGITVAVLYIPYQTIQNPTTIWNNEDGAANANIANIPTHLKACASSGFYFTANTPADITAAMKAMFQQSLQAARLTQ